MGRVKAKLMEYEEKVSFLYEMLDFFRENKFDYIRTNTLIDDLKKIIDTIENIHKESTEFVFFIAEIITDNLIDTFHSLTNFVQNYKKENSDIIEDLIESICSQVKIIEVSIRYIESNTSNIYNSEEYYNNQIESIKKHKEELEKKLGEIQKKNNDIQGEKEKQRVIYERGIQQKELELQNVTNQLEEKKKQDNVIEEWKKKITETFEVLKSHLNPIRNEHKRLRQMFKTYAFLSFFVFILIATLEIVICIKFYQCQNLPEWKDFFVLFLPIPLTGGLLWAFITQMNRAQRQLIILANQIHEIEYIEGVLISINSLSVDINDSIKRINLAIEKLLENHLHLNHTKSNYNEESIVKEENKDMVPTDLIIKILKELKSVSPK